MRCRHRSRIRLGSEASSDGVGEDQPAPVRRPRDSLRGVAAPIHARPRPHHKRSPGADWPPHVPHACPEQCCLLKGGRRRQPRVPPHRIGPATAPAIRAGAAAAACNLPAARPGPPRICVLVAHISGERDGAVVASTYTLDVGVVVHRARARAPHRQPSPNASRRPASGVPLPSPPLAGGARTSGGVAESNVLFEGDRTGYS